MQKTALITQLEQTHSVFGDSHSLSYQSPPGVALHGDEWELILGIEMLFAWGLCGGGKAFGRCLKCTVLERRPEAALENTQLSPETHGGQKASHKRDFQEHQGLLGSQAEQELQIQLCQAQRLFLGKSNTLSRKLQNQ